MKTTEIQKTAQNLKKMFIEQYLSHFIFTVGYILITARWLVLIFCKFASRTVSSICTCAG